MVEYKEIVERLKKRIEEINNLPTSWEEDTELGRELQKILGEEK